MTAAVTPAEVAKLLKPYHNSGEIGGLVSLAEHLTTKINTEVTAVAADVTTLETESGTTATIAYAASVTTDGIEATITVKDGAGATIAAIHSLNVWISDDADGSGLTATAASGALTAATGTILTALTAKKHVIANTAATGILKLLLVDAANTVGERFCVANPVNGKAIVGAATVGTDYQGGA